MSGTDPDFRPRGVGVDMYLRSLMHCPTCNFTAQPGDFDKTVGLDKTSMAKALNAMKSSNLFRKHDAALTVQRHWKKNLHAIARLTLGANWLADDTGEPKVINDRLDRAIKAHNAALAALDKKHKNRAPVTYLIGELLRQRGKTKEAIAHFDLALPLASQRLRQLIQQQRERAKNPIQGIATNSTIKPAVKPNSNDKPADLIAAFNQATPAQKIVLIESLREHDDVGVNAALNEFCLTGPDDTREQAMEALVGEQPKRYHLPIFLDAIGNEHFRTVQGGAHAAQLLRAKAAGTRILKALKKPVENTMFVLYRSLAGTTNKHDIPELEKLAENDRFRSEILRALLMTESSEAIDAILKVIDKTDIAYTLHYHGSVGREALQSAVKIKGLIDRLPKLAAASPDSSRASFKIFLLETMQTQKANDEIATALDAGNSLSIHAARALIRRGDKRGKRVFLTNLLEIMWEDYDSYRPILPLLEPNDYDAVHQAWTKEHKSHEESATFMREQLAETKDEGRKTRIQEQLDSLVGPDSAWRQENWLRLFGATGNLKAKPMLLKYLDDANHQARSGAIDGLTHVYDKEIGDRLVKRLQIEKGTPRADIIRVLGNSGDARQLETLLTVANEPTRVDTKLVWIEAVGSLDGLTKAHVTLAYWATSSNTELAKAATQALK